MVTRGIDVEPPPDALGEVLRMFPAIIRRSSRVECRVGPIPRVPPELGVREVGSVELIEHRTVALAQEHRVARAVEDSRDRHTGMSVSRAGGVGLFHPEEILVPGGDIHRHHA